MAHKWAQIFYLNVTGTGVVAADLNTLCTTIGNAWNTRFAPQVTSNVVLTGLQIVYIPSVGNEVVGSATRSNAGTRAGPDIADASACYVINWHISAYYRGGHPRTYLPAPVQADMTNGSTINSTQLSAVATAASNFLSDVNAATTTNISALQMGTLSFQTGNVWRNPPIFRPYTGVSMRTILGSQRRRLKS